jgi:hypothetical protein
MKTTFFMTVVSSQDIKPYGRKTGYLEPIHIISARHLRHIPTDTVAQGAENVRDSGPRIDDLVMRRI